MAVGLSSQGSQVTLLDRAQKPATPLHLPLTQSRRNLYVACTVTGYPRVITSNPARTAACRVTRWVMLPILLTASPRPAASMLKWTGNHLIQQNEPTCKPACGTLRVWWLRCCQCLLLTANNCQLNAAWTASNLKMFPFWVLVDKPKLVRRPRSVGVTCAFCTIYTGVSTCSFDIDIQPV